MHLTRTHFALASAFVLCGATWAAGASGGVAAPGAHGHGQAPAMSSQGAASAVAVDVAQPWARATVPGQSATGVFARLTAREATRLTGGSSPVASVVEIHEMKMDGNVMRMRALEAGLALPAGRAVDLKPGGYHVMVMGLKQALPEGATLPLTLTFTDAQGRAGEVTLQVPVRSMRASGHSHGAH
jgi:copper(I)-binding protein